MNLKEVIKISRPRFWIYEAATFGLIGTVSSFTGVGFFSDVRYWIFAFYFLVPANILIYGINDIFDYETDKLNPKKGTYEELVTPDKQKSLWLWTLCTNIPFLFFVPRSLPLIISFGAFLFFASFYSAKPIRAKSKPFIDSFFSAGHYVATGVFGYYLSGGTAFPLLGIVSGMFWAIAMHAYSAVPDIQADKDAKLKTIAILFGEKKTILICWFLYVLSSYLVKDIIPIASFVSVTLFSCVMFMSYKTKTSASLFKIYTYFPIINTIVGTIVSMELFSKILF